MEKQWLAQQMNYCPQKLPKKNISYFRKQNTHSRIKFKTKIQYLVPTLKLLNTGQWLFYGYCFLVLLTTLVKDYWVKMESSKEVPLLQESS